MKLFERKLKFTLSKRKLRKKLNKLLKLVHQYFAPTQAEKIGIAVFVPDVQKYVVFFDDDVEVVEPDNITQIPYSELRDGSKLLEYVYEREEKAEEGAEIGRTYDTYDYDYYDHDYNYDEDVFYPRDSDRIAEFKEPRYWIEGYEKVRGYAKPEDHEYYHYYRHFDCNCWPRRRPEHP